MVVSNSVMVCNEETTITYSCLSKRFIVHNLRAPLQRGVPKLKEDYAYVILGLRNVAKELCNVKVAQVY